MFFRVQNVVINGSDVSPCLSQDVLTALNVLLESCSEIEEYMIRGMVYIVDMEGVTLSYLKILPVEDAIKVMRNCEKILTARHKGFHIVNLPSFFNYLVNIGLANAPKKFRDRVKFYSSFDELTFIDKKILPKEYGGTVPMEEMSSEYFIVKSLCKVSSTIELFFQNHSSTC